MCGPLQSKITKEALQTTTTSNAFLYNKINCAQGFLLLNRKYLPLCFFRVNILFATLYVFPRDSDA